MDKVEYERRREDLAKTFHLFNIDADDYLAGQFNIVSASLHNFLPGIDYGRHPEIFKDILLYKKLSILEQESLHSLDFVTLENNSPDIQKILTGQCSIICTFHTGSYRLVNLLMARYGIPFTLAIGKDIGQLEGGHFSAIINSIHENTNKDAFRIINAENPNAGLQILRELRQGRTLVLYIDGNSGAGTGTKENENSSVINFLQQGIFARKGISLLAWLAKVPIITVASYRKSWKDIRLRFFDPIFPNTSIEREKFATESTQLIYDLVSPIIQQYPEQWEGWLYLHKVANVKESSKTQILSLQTNPGDRFAFNWLEYGLFKLNHTPFLLKKSSYNFYKISEDLYNKLSNSSKQPVALHDFGVNLLTHLYNENVLLQSETPV